VISFDEALALVASAAGPIGTERVPLDKADGRILAASIHAAIDSPRRDVSAMDGFAVREADLAELPVRLRIVDESFAGQEELAEIGPGECARIFTGGAVPAGADRIVIQEIVTRQGGWALIEQRPGSGRHIRKQGSDFRAGERLLPAGTPLEARTLVAAAAADASELEVWLRPRFTVVSTGDELAGAGTARNHPAAIPESVSFGVAALGEQWGGDCVGRVRLIDELKLLEEAAEQALDSADLVIVTGGASVGEKDFAKAMFGPAGLELLFAKVAIKPGKPVWLGRAKGRLVLGLPGNPTSAMVTARLFLAPLICGLAGGETARAGRWRKATLAAPLPACGDRETFLRARWKEDFVEVLPDQDSSAQKALAEAELLIRRLPNAPAAEAGETVPILDF
jgi:molybdopterin molybdotransferase